MNAPIPYLPATYTATPSAGIWFHFSVQEVTEHQRLVKRLVIDAVQHVESVLAYALNRRLHVCCYESLTDSSQALGRHVSPTLAMAPFSDERRCLIVIHSASLDPLNADETRLRRVLVHEVVHQAVAEKTKSTKVLGDNNANMNVASWLNEGLAEVIGLGSIGAVKRLIKIAEAFQRSQQFHTFEELSRRLDDLDDERRFEAFAHVTAAVQCLIQQMGIQQVFGQLERIGDFFQAPTRCTPTGMADYPSAVGHSCDTMLAC